VIRPYPCELEQQVEHRGRGLLLRPIRPEDDLQHRRFLARVTAQDLYTRFFTGVRELPDHDLTHLTHIDYDREMAFIATESDGAGGHETLAVARACADADNGAAEFAVLVRSDLKGQGLGTLLLSKLIGYCRGRGIRRLWGSVMAENDAMLHLARSLGFEVRRTEGNLMQVTLALQADASGSHGSGS
jgi:acetyltransferase